MTFNGFISYSHAADGRLAPAVQRGLHRLAKPWHRRRALWIFRDQTGLSVTPALWSSIQTALDGSDYFVLLASPEAAQSPWVNREIEHWMSHKSADHILPVVTDGEWEWDPERRDFTAESTAVPEALRGVFSEEPLYLDLRWARGSEHLSLQHSRFRDAIAQLAAPMHGVSKDELEGEDVRQHRRARRLRSGAVATLVVLTMLASLTSVSAVRNADRAKNAAAEALRQQQVAQEQRGSAERSAEEANRQQALARQQQNRAADAAADAEESERLAQEQQALADRAAAEAERQQQLADKAAKRTTEEQRLAKQASDRARLLEAEAQRLETEARRLAEVADEQERLARAAAAEAKRQQEKADKQEKVAVSQRLLNQARSTLDTDPDTALKLGAAAQHLQPSVAVRSALTGVVASTNYAGTLSDATSATYGQNGVVVSVGQAGGVSLWNVTNRSGPVRVGMLGDRAKAGGTVLTSRGGRTVALVTPQGRAVLWDVSVPSRSRRLATLPLAGSARAMAFTSDGRTLAVSDARGSTTLWDVADAARPARLATMTDWADYLAQNLAFSPDGSTLVVNKGSKISVYTVTDKAHPVYRTNFAGFGIVSMAFARTGNVLLAGHSDGQVGIYDLDDPLAIERSTGVDGLTGNVRAVAVSADGRRLAAGDGTGAIMLWDVTDRGERKLVTTVRTRAAVSTLSFAPDSRTLVGTDTAATGTLWNTQPSGAPEQAAALAADGERVAATTIHRDGRTLLAARHDGTATSWTVTDPARPVRRADLTIHGSPITAATFSPDGRTVATVGRQDALLRLTDIARPARPLTLATSDVTLVEAYALRFSADGRTLAVVTRTRLTLWDTSDRGRLDLLATMTGSAHFSPALAFSPDGRTLVSSSVDRTLTLWNLTGRARPTWLATLAGHNYSPIAAAVSPDGRTLVSGSTDNTAVLWNVIDRSRPHRLATLTGSGSLGSLDFSPDGRTLAAADGDRAVALWDLTDLSGPVRLATMRGFGGTPDEVLFKPDGRTVAVTAYDRYNERATVSLWSLTKLTRVRADPASYACAITGRGLSAEEWAGSIPELPYRRTCSR